MTTDILIWIIAAAATAGVILRPFGWPEAVWALAGAVLLVATRLITPNEALAGVLKGSDVYLFLAGMMLLSEVARAEGLFDWLAAHATALARGSASRLFWLIYGVGTLVTIFLSNDAAAVVLTPAVAAAARTARASQPLPYLFVCAFIANAASFVLPISNPANLVLYGSHMPPLGSWLWRYILPSIASIAVTFVVLRWTQRHHLSQPLARDVPVPVLNGAARIAAAGILATAVLLVVASALDWTLGLPTALAGGATAVAVMITQRKGPWQTVRSISWGVLPLVAGLFVLVEALAHSGLIDRLAAGLRAAAAQAPAATAWLSGLAIAVASNLMNNLPAGLVAAQTLQTAAAPDGVTRAVLIGVDLGPNLSITGSLATILWLNALRRENQRVSAFTFLKIGVLVTPPALLAALAAALLF